jgi:hypothetical protein
MIIMASAPGTLVPAIARLVAAGEDTVRDVIHALTPRGWRRWTLGGRESTGPDRDAGLDRIEDVTSACPDRCFASGQFGPLPVRPCHGACRARRGHPVRLRRLTIARAASAASAAATAWVMTSCGA